MPCTFSLRQQIQTDTKNNIELIEPLIKKHYWNRRKTAARQVKKISRIAKERLLKIQNTAKSLAEPRIGRRKEARNLQPKPGVSCKSDFAVQLLCQLPLHIPYLCGGYINELPK